MRPRYLFPVSGFFSGQPPEEKKMTNWSKRTKAIHKGTRRSQYGEVSEAVYLTQGFVYETAEAAEARTRHGMPPSAPTHGWYFSKAFPTPRSRWWICATSSKRPMLWVRLFWPMMPWPRLSIAALAGHPKLASLRYPTHADHPQHPLARAQSPTGGTVLAFEINGGRDACFRFLNALDLFTISNNFADAKSIVTHPATTTHQRLPQDQKDLLGISMGLVRLSVGLEDPADLIADLTQALDVV